MKGFWSRIVKGITVSVLVSIGGCGMSGDPGHCYFSLDWEYYSEDYGVFYYWDNNSNVPESEDIEPNKYYDCYPGVFDYEYQSMDPDSIYQYTGTYELKQNPGTPGNLFQEGMDGVDTYFDLYLYIYAKEESEVSISEDSIVKSTNSNLSNSCISSGQSLKVCSKADFRDREPARIDQQHYTVERNGWVLTMNEKVSVYPRHFNE